jgi:hypothetical protein
MRSISASFGFPDFWGSLSLFANEKEGIPAINPLQ